jgi:hypothetical protein
MKIKILILTAILAGLFMASCKKDTSTSATAITSVTIDKAKDTIRTPGGTTVLFATRAPANADNKNVIWTSSNPRIANVNQAGKVTYVAPGDVVITVTTVDGGFTATSNIHCLAVPVDNRPTFSLHTDQSYEYSGTDGPYEQGMSFRTSKDGQILKIKFYKADVDAGEHTGTIWTEDGSAKLATVVFTNETASGWQEATLSTPLNIVKNTVYVVSVNSVGGYVASGKAFDSEITNGPITGIMSFYSSAGPGTFPSEIWDNEDYYRDIVFRPTE